MSDEILGAQPGTGEGPEDGWEPESSGLPREADEWEGEPPVVGVDGVAAGEVRWLWPGKFPIGKLSLLLGDPGRGKSLLALDLAARLSRARPWPNGAKCGFMPSSTLLMSAEDDLSDTVRPRLDAADADAAYVHFFTGPGRGARRTGFTMPRDLGVLDRVLGSLRDVRLLVIDPLMAYISAGAAGNNTIIRAVLAALQGIAAEHQVAVLAISHLTKAPAAAPLYRAMGSVGLVAACRAVWTLWPDLDVPRRTFFIPLKCNLSAALHGMAYEIGVRPGYTCPVIHWEPQEIPLALLPTSTANPIARLQDQQCIAWLHTLLRGGPMASSTVERLAAERGFGRNTLRRAKAALGVQVRSTGFSGPWVWLLV